MKTGGDCNIFILLELLSKALDKDGSLSLIPKIMPSLLYTTVSIHTKYFRINKETRFKLMVEYSLMKI